MPVKLTSYATFRNNIYLFVMISDVSEIAILSFPVLGRLFLKCIRLEITSYPVKKSKKNLTIKITSNVNESNVILYI